MSFVYPRLVSFRRPGAQTGIGKVAYGGETAASETPVASNVRCSIQAQREGPHNSVGLPGDALRPMYYVYIPRDALDAGVVQERDVMLDERGGRYQVVTPYWDSMGHRLSVQSLEV